MMMTVIIKPRKYDTVQTPRQDGELFDGAIDFSVYTL
jgi:hypothetical protein